MRALAIVPTIAAAVVVYAVAVMVAAILEGVAL